jgi:hypothetical protein
MEDELWELALLEKRFDVGLDGPDLSIGGSMLKLIFYKIPPEPGLRDI